MLESIVITFCIGFVLGGIVVAHLMTGVKNDE